MNENENEKESKNANERRMNKLMKRRLTQYFPEDMISKIDSSGVAFVAIINSNKECISANFNLAMIFYIHIRLNRSHGEFATVMANQWPRPRQRVIIKRFSFDMILFVTMGPEKIKRSHNLVFLFLKTRKEKKRLKEKGRE
ncbi:Protein phosphatase 2C family protein [Trifolium repens]|jgi:hypothetical protein|nr:Protein phosphatase 2C family protein [Trifolium repens]